jgi:type IV secretion system protein VirD4
MRKLNRRSDTYNPLDDIDPEMAIDDCRDLAEALVVPTGNENEPHWNTSAEVWIAALTMAVVHFAPDGDKSLQSVRTVLTNPEKMQAAIQMMCDSDAWDGLLSRVGNQLKHFKDKELGSVLTTANRYLRFLDTPAIVESTKSSSFDPAELLTGKMTVYLILPPNRFRAQAGLLRMWIGGMLRACVKGGLRDVK